MNVKHCWGEPDHVLHICVGHAYRLPHGKQVYGRWASGTGQGVVLAIAGPAACENWIVDLQANECGIYGLLIYDNKALCNYPPIPADATNCLLMANTDCLLYIHTHTHTYT